MVSERIPSEPYALRISTATRSIVAAILTGGFGFSLAYALFASSRASASRYAPVESTDIAIDALLALFCLTAFWACAVNLREFADNGDDLYLDADGLRLRPAISKEVFKWDEISASRLVTKSGGRLGRLAVLEIEFTRRIFCFALPWGPRKIEIYGSQFTPDEPLKEAARQVRAYRLAAGWKR